MIRAFPRLRDIPTAGTGTGVGAGAMRADLPFRLSAASLAIISLCGPAYAAGYFIDQQSVPGLGRADAGNVAAASDPSTVFFNPAGMTELWGGADPTDIRRASSGAALIIPSNKLKNAGSTATVPLVVGVDAVGPVFGQVGVPIAGPNQSNPADPTPVGNSYMVQRLPNNNRLFFGLGLTAPFGLGGEFDDDWFGRYDATEVKLLTVNFSPVIAYKLSERISIGAGVDLQYADAKLVTAIPNPDPLTGTISALDVPSTSTVACLRELHLRAC
jgi:long-chain fatty acid transport protein